MGNLTQRSNGGFYFSEEVGFEPEVEKKNDKKSKGDKKDGKEGNKKTKQKN